MNDICTRTIDDPEDGREPDLAAFMTARRSAHRSCEPASGYDPASLGDRASAMIDKLRSNNQALERLRAGLDRHSSSAATVGLAPVDNFSRN